MTIRFYDFRMLESTADEKIKNYGKEIFTTDSLEEAREFMRKNETTMRFEAGGGKMINNDPCNLSEIYWTISRR